MDFNNRYIQKQNRVTNGNACMGIRRRVNDQTIKGIYGLLDFFNDFPLMVGLEGLDLNAGFAAF